MTELAPVATGTLDPSLAAGNTPAPELSIRFNTFEEAQQTEKKYSDTFIDGTINDQLKVGSEQVGIKGYLDNVEATDKDNSLITNPEAIAGLYLTTTEMVARNLKLSVGQSNGEGAGTERRTELQQAKEQFIANLHDESGAVADRIVDYCEGRNDTFPRKGVNYHGFVVAGVDILDAEAKPLADVRPNIKIQRQGGGTFIMGYSDSRVQEKQNHVEDGALKRIYLNPDAEAAPQVFEQVLQAANEAGIPLQLKMLQRAQELAWTNKARAGGQNKDGLRGDGIVIYTGEAQADEVLSMVLALAKDKPEAFSGRQTSRIAQSVAEGIAVGDEPTQKGESLTTQRSQMFNYAAEYVRKSGKTGQEARELFRNRVAAVAKANHVNPKNMAFNESITTETNATSEPGADLIEQEHTMDEATANKFFEAQVQQFVRGVHARAESEKRELNPDEVQHIRSLVQVVQQRRGAGVQETDKSTPVQAEKNPADEAVITYMKDHNIDGSVASQRYEVQVQQFVQGLRARADSEGRGLNAKEVQQIKTAVETVNNLRGFTARAA